MKNPKKKFEQIFNSMNHFNKEQKHASLDENVAALKTDHKLDDSKYIKPPSSVRRENIPMGNAGIQNLQLNQDVHSKDNFIDTEEDIRPVDKTAVMTGLSTEKHHHHHSKPKSDIKLQKAQELVEASKTKKMAVKNNKNLDELIKKHVNCPKCKECPSVSCAAQTVSPLEELATHSNELTFLSADDKPEDIKFQIMPQDLRDFVTKDVQVLNSERIIGYNTYNNILEQE